MRLWSEDFKDGELVPALFTCDGDNTSPSLEWSDMPAGTQSFALIVDDPDIPDFVKDKMGIEVFDHWVLFNIPSSISKIDRGVSVGVQGANTTGKPGYTGPCPPDREHRYFFKLYALDAMLDLSAGASRAEIESAMAGHVLEQASLLGRYERQTKGI
ncbi:MAG TPA: YbhB/YbcL family Raf kinase inhibitor-like protein [Candidatus Paceibacterota bacterium]